MLFRANINHNDEYCHANNVDTAVKKLQRRSYAKYGNFNITDLHCKFPSGWSRVPFSIKREYFTERELKYERKRMF